MYVQFLESQILKLGGQHEIIYIENSIQSQFNMQMESLAVPGET